MNMNKLKLRFEYKPEEEEDLRRDEITERLGEEVVRELEDLMLCP
jgi:hypothetical protein